jgi:hypothetical protein
VLSAIEQERNLTADECEELADALPEAAAVLPSGQKKQETTKLSDGYRTLAQVKRLVSRMAN